MDLMSQSERNLKNKRKGELHWQTFLVALGVAAAFFLPYIFLEKGYFLFYGDFNVQQVPFYQMCHSAVKGGDIFWNWGTDLGANFIGSYSFYLLGSPFFWVTLPFPNWMVPYLMGPLLMLKFALSALTAYLYIRRFVKRPSSAMLGGLLYAFSGFSVYNVFFNHFHEAIVFFPLLLLAMELYITERRRGVLALAVFICALSNYFFFFGMAVFCVIYWIVRTATGCWKMSAGQFFGMLLEVIIGGLMAGAILVPTVLALMQNSRLDNFLYGWNAFLYNNEQRYLNIIECFFFPPDLPARPVFFDNANAKWSSLGGWLPLVGMTGVIAWLQYKRGTWLRRLLCILIFMSMIPVLNASFTMFNEAYYARWFYMPILMMSLATVMALEDHSIPMHRAFRWSFGITLAFTLVIGLFPAGKNELGDITRFGLYTADAVGSSTFKLRFWITAAIALTALIVFRLLLVLIKRRPKLMNVLAICCVCIFSTAYSFYFISCGKTHSYSVDEVMIPQLLEAELELPGDKTQYRIDVYDGVDNTGMYLGYDSINAFHSIVPGSVTEFYEYIGEERVVASRPTIYSHGIRSMLSVKYLLDPNTGKDFTDSYGDPKMPGFSLFAKDVNGYDIYENQCYIPYGFTYDYYMTEEQCSYYGNDNRHLMLLKAILLTDEQAAKYSFVLKNIAEDYIIGGEGGLDGEFNFERKDVDFTSEGYTRDCAERRAHSAYSFVRDNRGFTASVSLEKDNLVFFSVPYEEGWSATVNGEEVEIEKVNGGFMAVLVPAGASTIRFDYTTPGLCWGVMISLGGVALLLIYVLAVFIIRRCKKYTRPSYDETWPEYAQLETAWANSDDIDMKFQYLQAHGIDFDEEMQMNLELAEQKRHRFDKSDDSQGFNIDLSAAEGDMINFDMESFMPEELPQLTEEDRPEESNCAQEEAAEEPTEESKNE